MLLKMTVLERIRAGDVSLVFRRWRRPTVKAGGQLRTAVGMLRIVDVRQIRVAARTLAERLGCERDWLKPNVRKLKNLGLTISHDPGYALSPRGRVVLTHLRSHR